MKKTLLLVAAAMLSLVSASAVEFTLSMEELAAPSFTKNGVTFVADKAEGGTAPAYNAGGKDVRLYAKNTLTVSCEVEITSLVFNLSSQGLKRAADVAASVGECVTDVEAKTVTWTGSAKEIVFTVGEKSVYGSDGAEKAGQLDFVSVDVTLNADEIPADPEPEPEPEPAEVEAISVAEFLAKADTEKEYQLKGVVANIKNTTYGNFDLVDGEASIYIYGLLTADKQAKQFASLGIEEGDTLTLTGVYTTYNDAPQIANAVYVKHVKGQAVEPEPVDVEAISVAEFLAKADTEKEYQLTGVVANIKNTTYGNFDLVDSEASIYIYGLLTADKQAKQFASLGIEEGDTLTLTGVYTTYNDAPQIANAVYVKHVKGQAPEPVDVEAISIAEFLAKADTQKEYLLTGVVANIKNTVYGNFDLVDGEASIYIYGLLTADKQAKQFASLGIEEGDTLTLVGVYTTYNDAPQIANAIYVSHAKGQPAPVVTPDTLTVAEAVAIAQQLADKEQTSETYVIIGYVTEIATEYSEQYGNISLWIADSPSESKVFELYRAKPAKESDINVKPGDKVQVEGKIQKYGTTLETPAGAVYTIIEVGSGIELVNASELVTLVNGNMIVNGEGNVQLYNVAGQMLYNNRSNGQVVISGMQHGQVLIVRVGNKAAKVVL